MWYRVGYYLCHSNDGDTEATWPESWLNLLTSREWEILLSWLGKHVYTREMHLSLVRFWLREYALRPVDIVMSYDLVDFAEWLARASDSEWDDLLVRCALLS